MDKMTHAWTNKTLKRLQRPNNAAKPQKLADNAMRDNGRSCFKPNAASQKEDRLQMA